MSRTRTLAAVGLAALLALAGEARPDVDLELANGDRAVGSITEPGGSDVYRVRVPAGADLDVSVKGVRRSRKGPLNAVTFRLFDAQDGEPAAAAIAARGKGARLRRFPVPGTGEYRVVVSGVEAGGDYKLKVSWRQLSRLRFGADTEAEGPPGGTLGIDAGSTVRALIKAARRSDAVPRLDRLLGTESGASVPFEPLTNIEDQIHRATVTVTRTDSYQILTSVIPDRDGVVVGVVKVKPDRTRSRLTLNTSRLAAPGTGGVIFARGVVVGPDGATVRFGGDADGALIEGASVVVPAGAIGAPVPILIGSSTDVAPLTTASGGGPSMFCGPSGTTFAVPATVTMPFNPHAFDAQQTGLSVQQRDARGRIVEITDGVTVDAGGRQVSFPVSSFSSFRIVGPPVPAAPRGDVTGDAVADLVVRAQAGAAVRLVVFAGGQALLGSSAIDTTSATAAITDDVAASAAFGGGLGTADVNGDGVEDLVATDPVSCAAYVFFGGASFGSAAASAAGVTIAGGAGPCAGLGLGDVDDDAIADVVLGAPSAAGSAPTGAPGSVFAFGGRRGFDAAASTALDPGDPGLRTLTGEADLDEFGTTVVVADVTGDGLADIVVAATRDGAGRAARAPGRVYVFPGSSSATSAYAAVNPATATLEGATADERFGATLAVGDVNGDGVGDVVVGAPGTATDARGALHVFFGGAALAGTRASSSADRSYTGSAPGDRLGMALLVVDLTGDGIGDVVAGAPGVDLGSGPNAVAGAVLVFRGGRRERDIPASGRATGATRGIIGAVGGEHFGSALEAADLDGDGAVDLIVAAPFHDATLNGEEGRVYVFRGPLAPDADRAGRADLTVTGTAGERLGAPDAARLPQ